MFPNDMQQSAAKLRVKTQMEKLSIEKKLCNSDIYYEYYQYYGKSKLI